MATKLIKNLFFADGVQKVAAKAAAPGLGYKQALAYAPATKLTVLDNGMKVASETNGSATASVGLWVDVGSRNETAQNNGVGNLFEHMVFKGTASLSQVQLEKEVKSLGATFKVSRNRELTGITATCLSEDVPRVVELLADVVQNASFDEAEIEKQKLVMLAKLDAAESTDVNGVLLDLLHSVAFQGTALAQGPAGTTQSIQGLRRDDLLDMRRDHLIGPRMVLSAAGGVDQDQLAQMAAQHFTSCAAGKEFSKPVPYCRFTGSEVKIRDDDMPVGHVTVAFQTPGHLEPDEFLRLELAKIVMGSWDPTKPTMLSGIGLAKRCANYDTADCYSTFNIGYKDTGLFGVHLTGKRMKILEAQEHVADELMHLCETVADTEVKRAKNQLRTQLFSQLQSNAAVQEDIATQVIYHGRRVPLLDLENAIEEITTKSMADVCDKYIFDCCLAQSGLGSIEQMFPYLVYRKKFKWFRI